jgi:triosephosphate isomerase
LVGHSERRKLFEETNEIVAEKVKIATKLGIRVILCVGETIEERELNRTNEVLAEQITAVKELYPEWNPDQFSIAYEPVWAIGTGKVASPAQAQESHLFIRKWVSENISEEVAEKTRIIYGGSVTDKNAE